MDIDAGVTTVVSVDRIRRPSPKLLAMSASESPRLEVINRVLDSRMR